VLLARIREENIMDFFKYLFSPTKSAYRKLNPLTQNRIALVIPATQLFLDLFKIIEKRAVLRKIVVHQFNPIGRSEAANLLVPFVYGLVCLNKLKENSDFLKSDEHQDLFNTGVGLLMSFYEESCKFMKSQLSPELPDLNFTIGVTRNESEEVQRNHMMRALNSISSDSSIDNISAAKHRLFNWLIEEAKISDADVQYLTKNY
jgi:hypothetical protein